MYWKPSTTSEDVIMHSAKGSHWGKHKYIAIKNGRYIYPGDKTDAYKKAQKAASEHAPHFEGKAGEGEYTYKYRTNSPGSSHNKLSVPYGTKNSKFEAEDPNVKRRLSENPTHMRSDVERWDYFAGAAAKKDSTKKRMTTAKSLARDAEESLLGELAKKKPAYYSNPDQKKWETVAKSAGYRQKQKEALAKKNAEATEKQKKNAAINEANLDAARIKYRKKKQAKYESDRQKKIGTNLALSGYTKEEGRKTAEYKKSMGIKPVNKTARKNQFKNKLATVTFKSKYKAKKLIKALSKPFTGSTKRTVTDTFTGKKRTVKQANPKSKDTINIKQLSKKNKKRG